MTADRPGSSVNGDSGSQANNNDCKSGENHSKQPEKQGQTRTRRTYEKDMSDMWETQGEERHEVGLEIVRYLNVRKMEEAER